MTDLRPFRGAFSVALQSRDSGNKSNGNSKQAEKCALNDKYKKNLMPVTNVSCAM